MAYPTPSTASTGLTTGKIAGGGSTGVVLSTGILDVWSKELMFAAQPILKFNQIAVMKTELGAQPGYTIKIPKYAPLQVGQDALVEGTDLVKGNIDTSYAEIRISERGRALTVSEFALQSSFLSLMQDMSTLLGRHMAESIDSLLKMALFGYGCQVIGSGMPGYHATATTANQGAITQVKYCDNVASHAALTSANVMNIDMIREMVVTLAESKAPKFGGDAYICYIHPQQGKNLRKDSAWVNAQNYASPDNILRGEIGRFEDVRFIETTMCPKIAINSAYVVEDGVTTAVVDSTFNSTKNTNCNVYKCVMVGENCLGMAVGQPGTLRDNGIEDFGRRHSIAWYGIWGADVIEPANGVIGLTA